MNLPGVDSVASDFTTRALRPDRFPPKNDSRRPEIARIDHTILAFEKTSQVWF
jgi:hypothetical protein